MTLRIQQDRRYKTFSIDDDDISSKIGDDCVFHLDRTPRRYFDDWSPIKIEFYHDSKKQGVEIPDISANNGKMFVNQAAYEILSSELKNHGEFLPVYFDGGSGFLYNSLTIAEDVDGLNEKMSVDDPYGGNGFIVFHEENVKPIPVFRTKFDTYDGLFCNETFRKIIDEEDLRGIVFSPDLGNMFPPDPTAANPPAH